MVPIEPFQGCAARGWRGCQPSWSKVAEGRRPALAHLRQRRRLARSCTNVVGGCLRAAKSTSFGALHREHWIPTQRKPPLIAWSIVGEGSIGSPSLHIRSFQLSQSSLSACWIRPAPLARISADCAARMPVIARDFPNSFVRAFRSPPDSGVGWCFGAIRTSKRRPSSGCRLGHVKSWPAPVFLVSSGALLAGGVEQSLRDVLPDRVAAIQSDCIGGLDFHGPLAATAGDAQHVALNLGKTSLPHLGSGRIGPRVFEHRFPILRREGSIRRR